MKFSLNWLKDYISPGIPTDKLAHKLTMAGLEVEKVHKVGKDSVFEIEVTPNRADCLSMVGIAREVSAVLNKPRKNPKISKRANPSKKYPVVIKSKADCARYIGTVIEGVHLGAAPTSIVSRLSAIGTRSISNVVDITNFVLMELGQPLHAFDLDKLRGGKIVVRRAKKGEKIVTIDDVERELDPSVLVIADAERPVAIAGIMGGKDTEVTSSTKNILLESARFDSVLIRHTARKLGLSSDSSYRFERGIDAKLVELGSYRAVSLILEHAGGKVTQHSDVKGLVVKMLKKNISISVDEINELLGANITKAQCTNILKKLDFKVTPVKAGLKVEVPTFRPDVHGKVDIIEEVSRVIGYDNLPSSQPLVQSSSIVESNERRIRKTVRENLIGQGLSEIITYSMTNQEALDKAQQGHLKGVPIKNPLSQDQERMRPSMLPSLLTAVQTNVNRGYKNLRFFEMGKIYSSRGETGVVSMICTGMLENDWRSLDKKEMDFYDVKGILNHALQAAGVENLYYESNDEKHFEPGQAATIKSGNNIMGTIGRINEEVLSAFDIRQDNVYFAQAELNDLYKKAKIERTFEAMSEYPNVVRDLSLEVSKDVMYRQIELIARSLGGKALLDVQFRELYMGDKISKGKKGIIFSLIFQSRERTLREEEVSEATEKILKKLSEDLAVVQR